MYKRQGADSLEFLSLEKLYKIAPDARCGFCDGCFTEHYPLEIPRSHLDAPLTTCGESGEKQYAPRAMGNGARGIFCQMADRSVSGLFAALRPAWIPRGRSFVSVPGGRKG